jgi:hypothetical protein
MLKYGYTISIKSKKEILKNVFKSYVLSFCWKEKIL